MLDEKILDYCLSVTTAERPELQFIDRQTHLKTMLPQMISGHMQGRLLSMISHMIRPQLILEIGTFTGYSTVCLAEGLHPSGRLITIELREELAPLIEAAIAVSPRYESITSLFGHALELMDTIPDRLDLVYIDGAKMEYGLYFDAVLPRVNIGGIILVDNTLWDGRVIGEDQDKLTRGIKEFNQKVLDDGRVENVLLPIFDGLHMCRRIG